MARPGLYSARVKSKPKVARPVILLPTYNERENLEAIVNAIHEAQPGFAIVVIDDNSPDGTGDLADRIAAEQDDVFVLHRRKKEGLGRAYLAGMQWALDADAGYTHVFEMDADFSHDPKYLGPILEACVDGADLAIGSRWAAGGGTKDWPAHRQAISRGGSLYSRTVLGMKVRDITAGFMCYRRETLERLPLDEIQTSGYGFQIEMKYRCHCMGLHLVEIPIVFAEREKGQSKMSTKIFIEGLALVWKLRFSGIGSA
jgi:dolichol-phosphate mannosyltransferase